MNKDVSGFACCGECMHSKSNQLSLTIDHAHWKRCDVRKCLLLTGISCLQPRSTGARGHRNLVCSSHALHCSVMFIFYSLSPTNLCLSLVSACNDRIAELFSLQITTRHEASRAGGLHVCLVKSNHACLKKIASALERRRRPLREWALKRICPFCAL
jgi:hypothetical protein